MAVGPEVKKFTWLLDHVEVRGIVRVGDAEDGRSVYDASQEFDFGGGKDRDWFDIELDPNYAHFVDMVPGVNGRLHCESSNIEPVPENLNRIEKYEENGKEIKAKGEMEHYQVIDPVDHLPRDLKVGDHVRVIGRWVIENGHPGKKPTGFLRGVAFLEFHPFWWENMELIGDLKPADAQVEMLSLAAPLYEEIIDRWEISMTDGIRVDLKPADAQVYEEMIKRWEISLSMTGDIRKVRRIYLNGSNFHNRVTANAYIKAPPLPAGFTPHSSLIQYHEEILLNGTGLDLSRVRSLAVVSDGIKVTAAIVAPATQYVGSVPIADFNDPANNRSVFQARYTVRWKPRLVVVDSRGLAGDQLETIQLAALATGSSYQFLIYLANRGPDPLTITKIEVKDDPDSVFQIDPTITFPLPVPQMSVLTLRATFSPKKSGIVTAKLLIHNNDPVQEILSVQLTSAGIGDLAQVEVSPLSLDFGQVRVGTVGRKPITLRNLGNINASVSEVDISPASMFHPPHVNQPGKLLPGQSQVTDIRFFPNQRGVSQGNAKLFIWGSSPVPQEITIALKGQGIAPILVLDPPIMDFGAIPPGKSRTLPLRILNNGDASLTVNNIFMIMSTVKGAFSLDAAQTFPFSVAPSSSLTLQVTYSAGPIPGRAAYEEWEVDSDDPVNHLLRLLLRGLAGGPRIDVRPDFIDFHQVQQVPALVDVTVRNDGSSELVVERMVLEHGADFSLVGVPGTPVKIAAGSEFVFQVQFRALTPGRYQDRLIVYSNDAGRSQVRNMIEAILG